MKLQKETLQNIVKATVFLLILLLLFLCFTYLFRDTSDGKRGMILNYYAEPDDTLDVVTIGASTISFYWDPLRAWNDYGFTSYNYAVSSMKGGTYLAALKDALKTQSPELVVIEARLFTRGDTTTDKTMGARHLLDCWDFGLSRLQAVKYYCDTIDIPWKESIDLYVDLIYYHNNYEALITPQNWKLADNSVEYSAEWRKGYTPYSKVRIFEDPSANLLDTSIGMQAQSETQLRDILEYCRQEGIQVMLLATPVVITKTEAGRFYQISRIAEEYGVPFLDANLCYEQIGIDFSQDFGDIHHVSILGADKFTDFFGKYLKENYDLPDHRADPAFAYWNEAYENYLQSSDAVREKAYSQIETRKQLPTEIERMQQTEDLLEWLTLADNGEFTLFVLSVNPAEGKPASEGKMLLQSLGIEESYWKKPFAIMYCNKVVNKGTKNEISGKIANSGPQYAISATSQYKMELGGTNYAEEPFDGIRIVVYSDTYMNVVDQIQITWEPDGKLRVVHQ